MKIAVTSEGRDLSSAVDVRFGRARGFIVYDLDTGDSEYLDNAQVIDSPQGAGIQAAKLVADTGAGAVITGNVGPKAHNALSMAGVAIYTCGGSTVREAIDDFKAGRLTAAEAANVEGHW